MALDPPEGPTLAYCVMVLVIAARREIVIRTSVGTPEWHELLRLGIVRGGVIEL